MKILVCTEYPGLVDAIRRAGHDPVVVCPRCGRPAREVVAEANGKPAFRCDPCCAAWLADADIDEMKKMLQLLPNL